MRHNEKCELQNSNQGTGLCLYTRTLKKSVTAIDSEMSVLVVLWRGEV